MRNIFVILLLIISVNLYSQNYSDSSWINFTDVGGYSVPDWRDVDNSNDSTTTVLDNGWILERDMTGINAQGLGFIPNIYPDDVSLWYHYRNTSGGSINYIIRNLNPSKTYYIEILSSRNTSGDPRNVEITLQGDSKIVDVVDNTTLLVWNDVVPSNDSISFTVDTAGGTTLWYLNAMKVFEIDDTTPPIPPTPPLFNGWGEIAKKERSNILDNRKISHNQYYVIPENVYPNDYVGQWHWNKVDTIFNNRAGAYSYNVTSSSYSINASGMLSVIDTSLIRSGIDTLLVTTSIDSDSEIDTAFIFVIDSNKCRFIDMDNGNNSNDGSRISPKLTLNTYNNNQVEGYAYFLKRGTEQTTSETGYADTNNIYVSAYGQGAKPIMSGASIRLGEYGTKKGNRNVFVSDIFLNQESLEITPLDSSNWITRISGIGYDNNAMIYQYGTVADAWDRPPLESYTYFSDCDSDASGSHGFKLGSQYIAVNMFAENAIRNGITVQEGKAFFTHCLMHNNSSQYGYEIDEGNNHVQYSVSQYNDVGYMFAYGETSTGENNDNNLVELSIARYNGNGFFSEDGNNATETCNDNIIQDNDIYGNTRRGLLIDYEMNGTIIRRNKIFDNLDQGLHWRDSDIPTATLYAYYNLLYGNGNTATEYGAYFQLTTYDTLVFDNNTILDNQEDVQLGSSTTPYKIMRNNIFETFSNLGTADVFDSNLVAIDGSWFINRTTNDYMLKPNSQPVNNGINANYSNDLTQKSVPFNFIPDAGAYELSYDSVIFGAGNLWDDWVIDFNYAIYDQTGSNDTIIVGTHTIPESVIRINSFIKTVTNDTIIYGVDDFKEYQIKYNNTIKALE